MPDKLTLTAKEAAELLNVSMPTLYTLCRLEGFPSLKIGKKVLISREGLARWLEQQTGGIAS